MKSRFARGLAVYLVTACLLAGLAAAANTLTPETGLRRSIYTQADFAGTPIDERTAEVNLEFLNDRLDLPRRFFSVRWRGFVFLDKAQPVEFFAGGDDQVELRVDGQLLVRRSPREGMGTRSRTLPLEAGAHEISVDYQQFGGGMSLNIQRAIAGGAPGPFLATELFTQPVEARQVWISKAAQWLNRSVPIAWAALPVMLVIGAAPWAIARWRATGAPHSTREYVRRAWLVAAPALLAPAVLFILGPRTIFTTNRGEFAVTFGDLALPWLLRTTGFNWIVLFGVGCALALFSDRLTRIYAASVLVFGLLLWAQGNLWNADYGVLAGREIDLAEHATRAPYELAAWLVGLTLAWLFFRPVSRLAPFAALVFMGVQAGAAAFTSAEPAGAQRARWMEPPPAIYQFSTKQNVIHVVLDEFQSDLFAEMLQHDRAALDRQFSGFEYFSDHAGAFPTTSFSMPAMMTGLEYRNDKHAPEFVRDAFKQASVFENLSRAGYEIDATSIVPIASFEEWLGPEATPNWRGARFRIRKPFVSLEDYREASARQLLELSLFRHVPHSVKVSMTERPAAFDRALWMERRDSPADVRRHEASNSAAFLEHFTRTMTVGREQPVYKLLHVGIPHRPIVVDGECRFVGITAMSRRTFADQSQCAITLVAALLDRARDLGIYDSSLIIVSSDHGTDLPPLGFIGTSESLSLVPGPSTSRLTGIAGAAKALMLIKRPHRSGPVTTSDAPTAHADLPSTILDVLGLPGVSPGLSMFRRDPSDARRRAFGMYDFRQRFPKTYLDRLDVLSIDGRIENAGGWNLQKTIFSPELALEARDIDFGTRAAARHAGPGWSLDQREADDMAEDVTFVRALTSKAVLFAHLPRERVDLVFRLSAPDRRMESVRVEIDGREVARLTPPASDSFQDYTIRVPDDSARPSISTVVLHFAMRESPVPNVKLDRLVIRVGA